MLEDFVQSCGPGDCIDDRRGKVVDVGWHVNGGKVGVDGDPVKVRVWGQVHFSGKQLSGFIVNFYSNSVLFEFFSWSFGYEK